MCGILARAPPRMTRGERRIDSLRTSPNGFSVAQLLKSASSTAARLQRGKTGWLSWGVATMPELSRRQHLKQLGALAGTAAMSGLSAPAFAADAEIPPQGIGKGIKHISYSDIGGRPDSVQVM